MGYSLALLLNAEAQKITVLPRATILADDQKSDFAIRYFAMYTAII